MKLIRILLAASLAAGTFAEPITVASWNFGWLRNEPVPEALWPTCQALPQGRDEREQAMASLCDKTYPSDKTAREQCMTQHPCRWTPRRAEAYKILGEISGVINADVIAVQEVEGTAALEKVFPGYKVFVAGDDWLQKVGFAVRADKFKEVSFKDYEGLAKAMGDRRGRGGELTVVDKAGKTIKFFNVHLKSGCFDKPLGRDEEVSTDIAKGISKERFNDDGSMKAKPRSEDTASCNILARQVKPLEQWIDGAAASGIPYVLLGDFNRRFDSALEVNAPARTEQGNQLTIWKEINDSEPPESTLTRINERRRTVDACSHKGRYPVMIDHIIVSKSLAAGVQANSFRQWPVNIEDPELSDHCPISAVLDWNRPNP
ncbi:endonuclease/exonuclease/phosphatase family protein [Chitinimonas naiadis]